MVCSQRLFATLALSVLIAGCATPHEQFYRQYIDPTKAAGLVTLTPGDQPQVFASNDLMRDVKVARARGFVPIGESSFVGGMASQASVLRQATNVGAVMVLVNASFKDTQQITTPLFLPNDSTTYTSGSVYGTRGSASFSGTSTTQSTVVVPVTTTQDRYQQTAVFFAKAARPPRVGISPMDLTPELRAQLQRNTGVLVDFVYDGSPAFVANLMAGDVMIEANGTPLINQAHGSEVFRSIGPGPQKVPVKILRNGVERTIEIDLPATRP